MSQPFVPGTRHRTVKVLMTTLGLALIAVSSTFLLAAQTPQRVGSVHLPWPVLLVMFAAVEVVVLHVQVKREARTISMSEIPLVLGMFFAAPVTVIGVRMLGSGLVYVLHRRQSPVKLSFNMALNAAETGLALVVFRATLGDSPGVGWSAWSAAYVAAVASNAFAGIAVTFVIYLYEHVLRWRDFLGAVTSGIPVATLTTTAGLIAVSCLSLDIGTSWLLGLAAVVIVLSYRAYASLSERHLSLERLYRFSQVVGSSPEVENVMRSVLGQARDLLQAEVAELTFLPGEGSGLRVVHDGGERLLRERSTLAPDDWLWREVVGGGSPALLSRSSKNSSVQAYLAMRGVRESIVAPLRGEAGVVGLIAVSDRMGSVRGFDDSDVRLLETVANHASVALEHGRLVDRLRYEALHDGLTGLPNRAALESATSEALVSHRSGLVPGLALMLMDLDGFKEVNDTLGHLHGDLLLCEVGRRLRATVPAGALVARLGGDEFAVLLPATDDVTQATAVARAVLTALEEPTSLDDVRLEIGASIGIALAPLHGSDVGTLLKCSDVAMYAAKADGRGAQVYSRDLDGNDPARLLLATQLREGLARDELLVFAQPLAELDTGRVVGVELLARWQHPERGLMAPDDFIPVAEKAGLLRPITSTVLGEGIAAAARWRDLGRLLTVSVNLSARSLLDPQLVGEVQSLLSLHAVAPEQLVLEITESGVISDLASTSRVLHQLRDLGVRLSVDDFGTGYSSLSYLSRLPVHEVKVDRHFVSGMTTDAQAATIVRSVVDLGQSLGLSVVAEGVEHQETWDQLRALGCDLAQGWWLAPPMPLAHVWDWLAQRESSPVPVQSAPFRTALGVVG